MSNICDEGFLQKLLTAKYQSQIKFTDFYYNRVHLRQDHFKFCWEPAKREHRLKIQIKNDVSF